MANLVLTGDNLMIDGLLGVVNNPGVRIVIAPTILKNIKRSREFLEQELDERVIYGVNTGFGPMASHIISSKNLVDLQENLVISHAVGMGAPIPSEYVLAAMVVRINTLAKGSSGVSIELLEQLKRFINERIIPIVPEHGAVGTSGDLVQLAHIALGLLGKGMVDYKGTTQPAASVLKKLGIKPYVLKPKEGLSLINGTSVMSGIGALVCRDAERLLDLAIRNGALALELVGAYDDGISKTLHELRPHPGQLEVAKILRSLLASSSLLRKREVLNKHNGHGETGDVKKIPEHVQEVYSLRCIPQILGPVMETIRHARSVVEIEMNSVSDNPIVDWKKRTFLHGGNFHGDYVAVAVDQLKMSIVKLTMLSERRINFFLNTNVNHTFPPFLNMKTPGLTLALQGLQFVATSTTAQSQSLAYPHNLHSIPTNGDNQDVVSMGTDAALLASKVNENATIVLAIELITLAQAVDITKIKTKLSRDSQKLFTSLRAVFPAVTDDRVLTEDLPKVIDFIKQQ